MTFLKLNNLFRSIALTGADRSKPEQFNATKTCNLLAIVACTVTIVQLPLQLVFWTEYSLNQILLICAHILLYIQVPKLNKLGFFCFSRIYLILVFSSYIGLSSINYDFLTHVHYFFLIAIFAVPFLHFDMKAKEVVLMMLYFLTIFLLWEGLLIPAQENPVSIESRSDLHLSVIAQGDKISFAMSCFLVGYFIYSSLKSSWHKIREEQQRSEHLLLNILPRQVAQRLEQKEKPIADYFENVSILFADIESFSTLSQNVDAAQLVSMLNNLFTRFDALCAKHNLEKIKTIGDQYMAVSGIPIKDKKHAQNVCRCAIRMHEEFILWTREYGITSSLRIGINSGPVVAGVIGIHKFSYDLWGDAVNLASRMESQGESGKIQISEATYDLIKGTFLVDYQETIEVKGMGQQNVYWLNEPYSV